MSVMDHHPLSDPQLSALYRQHMSAEPSAAVDRRILQAAREALEKGAGLYPRGVSGWKRWRTALALTASLLLSVTLALWHEHIPTSQLSSPEEAGRAPELPAESAAGRVAGPAAAPSVAASSAQAVPGRPAAPKALADRARGTTEPRERVDLGSNSGELSRAPVVRPSALEQHGIGDVLLVPTDSAVSSKAEFAIAPNRSGSGPTPAPASDGASPGSAASVGSGERAVPHSSVRGMRQPAAWMEEILRLHREGQVDAAERQLREFRRLYPDYLLPDTLRP